MSWRIADLTEANEVLKPIEGGFTGAVSEISATWDETAIILIGPNVTLGKGLLQSAAKHDTVILFCDWRSVPLSGSFPFGTTHSRIGRRQQAQATASTATNARIWKKIIQAKIAGQHNNLTTFTTRTSLIDLQSKVVKGDTGNIEGTAARVYWSTLFSDFSRERYSDDERNWALNYGYTVLRGFAIKAVISSGLTPTLGIHHHHLANPFALADDLIEPFRPSIDWTVQTLYEAELLDMSLRETRRALVNSSNYKMGKKLGSVKSEMVLLAQRLAGVYENGGQLSVPEWCGTRLEEE